MNLDIPDVHDEVSVSLHVGGFCEMLIGREPTRDTNVFGACVQRLLKEVGRQTGQQNGQRPESEGLNTAKVVHIFERQEPT